MPTIKEVVQVLEQVAPPMYQESYDNAGLIVGDASIEVTGVLTCLDSTEAVIEEAVAKGCNLVVAHHPIVFKGLKRFTGKNYVERTVIKAIQQGVAIYAIHTNLDNVYNQGVNQRIAGQLGLEQQKILAPKQKGSILSAYVLPSRKNSLLKDLRALGIADKDIYIGSPSGGNVLTGMPRLEILLLENQKRNAVRILKKNYVQQYNFQHSEAPTPTIGSGMIGQLPEPMNVFVFFEYLKEKMQVTCIKYTNPLDKPIEKVAVCGGAGGFLLKSAIAQGADIFITADYKYHEFFDADSKIIIADIGHFESEQFTIPLLKEIISNKFSTFAVYETEVRTNPVSYFV